MTEGKPKIIMVKAPVVIKGNKDLTVSNLKDWCATGAPGCEQLSDKKGA